MQNAIVIDAHGYKAEFVHAEPGVNENGETTDNIIDYTLKEGERVIYDGVSTALFMYAPQWTGSEWIETGSPPEPDIEALKLSKLTELNTACQNTIYAGVDVETSDGMKHFNLTDHDQINLSGYSNAITAARAGQPSMVDLSQGVWYKADGEGEHHRYWSIDDFQKIVSEAFAFKAEQLTYLDVLKTYVRDLQTASEVNAVHYGMPI